jgi:hypothetical protein
MTKEEEEDGAGTPDIYTTSFGVLSRAKTRVRPVRCLGYKFKHDQGCENANSASS